MRQWFLSPSLFLALCARFFDSLAFFSLFCGKLTSELIQSLSISGKHREVTIHCKGGGPHFLLRADPRSILKEGKGGSLRTSPEIFRISDVRFKGCSFDASEVSLFFSSVQLLSRDTPDGRQKRILTPGPAVSLSGTFSHLSYSLSVQSTVIEDFRGLRRLGQPGAAAVQAKGFVTINMHEVVIARCLGGAMALFGAVQASIASSKFVNNSDVEGMLRRHRLEPGYQAIHFFFIAFQVFSSF